ncbi:hypothetical protein NAF19_16845 [Mucilaginibacter sp. RT5R15]|nr:hypothetical protein [Mucilaginibacter flavidus]
MTETNLNLFRSLFLQAVSQVGAAYMRTIYGEVDLILQEVQGEAHRQHIEHNRIGDDLVKNGERIFCYELYHQLRTLLEQYPQAFEGVYLQGELRKYQVLPMLQMMGLEALSGNFIPDFLLHSPGDSSEHPYVIEVKTDRFLSYGQLAADISKLVEFIDRYGYQRGMFLSVNTSADFLRLTVTDCQLLRQIPHIAQYATQIDIVGRHDENSPVTCFNLAEIIH